MRLVVSLGNSALLDADERPDAAVERRHVRRAAAALAPLATSHDLVITCADRPQLSVLQVESEADPILVKPYPLDALGAQSQGMVGYWLAQELRNAGVGHPIAALITQTVVEPADPEFDRPTAFVGPGYRRHHAEHLAVRHTWQIGRDGDHWRRVVPCPHPVRTVELPTIRLLTYAHIVTICAGGGLPVIENDDGRLVGVDGVVNKDLAAALLAIELHADALLMLTDVPWVSRDHGTPRATPLRAATPDELAALRFDPQSMGPKVAACGRYVRTQGGDAYIGALDDAARILAGTTGTCIALGQAERQAQRPGPPGTP